MFACNASRDLAPGTLITPPSAVAAAGAGAQGAVRRLQADYSLWRLFPYEYEQLAIDPVNGVPLLREWVDDAAAGAADLDAVAGPDESGWSEERREHLLYR